MSRTRVAVVRSASSAAVHAQPPPDGGHEPLELGLGARRRSGRRARPRGPRAPPRAGRAARARTSPGIQASRAAVVNANRSRRSASITNRPPSLRCAPDAPVGEAERGERLAGRDPAARSRRPAAARPLPSAESPGDMTTSRSAAAEPLGQVGQHLGARVAVAVSLDRGEHHGTADDQVVDRDPLASGRRQLECGQLLIKLRHRSCCRTGPPRGRPAANASPEVARELDRVDVLVVGGLLDGDRGGRRDGSQARAGVLERGEHLRLDAVGARDELARPRGGAARRRPAARRPGPGPGRRGRRAPARTARGRPAARPRSGRAWPRRRGGPRPGCSRRACASPRGGPVRPRRPRPASARARAGAPRSRARWPT